MIVATSALALLAALQTPSTEGANRKAAAKSEAAQTLEEALASGEVTLELRYRWETVDDEAFTLDAQASTLRTVLGNRTRPYRGWSVHLEAENVADLGLEDRHDDGTGGSLADPETRRPMSGHVVYATRELGAKELPVVKLSFYALLLDFDRSADRELSTSTVGLEATGERALRRPWELHWEVEAAEQRDRAANPVDVDASYAHLMIGVERGAVTLHLGAEIFEGEPGSGRFTTPLATLHKFQGWADQFLATPEAGIEDLYLSLASRAGRWRSTAVYHDFSASSGSADYGTEVDLEVLFKSPWDLELGATAAFYDSRGFATDVRKMWIWGRYIL